MKGKGGLITRAVARLRAAIADDGERCRRCGVCHNVCGLMGREPGWLAGAGRRGTTPGPHPVDAKAQED